MPMDTCPTCAGSGSVHTTATAHVDADAVTWCRACSGSGLVRLPEEDDEHEVIDLLWPESIRWRHTA